MNTRIRVLATLTFVLASGHAAAIPILRQVTPVFSHNGSGNLNASLIVEASTDLLVLVIAGGFTISCNTSTLQQTAERLQTYSSFFGPREVLRIPEVVPSAYPILGWASIPEGTCGGQCVMQYKGEARDETSLSVRVGGTGAGVGFSLIPPGLQRRGDTILANVCRASRPKCCMPTCSVP